MRSSLSRNFLLSVGVTSVVVTIAAALSAFAMFQSELAHRQIDFLSHYVEERTSNLDRRFANVAKLQQSAVAALQRREADLKPGEGARLLDADLPLQPDGTRRSLSADFDGHVTPGGRLVYGMGAFVAHGRDVSDSEVRALVSAYPIVSSFGQAAHGEYDNFYFFTPSNRVIIFGPDRPDHLMFYRRQAPADLDFSQEEMVRLVLPSADPSHATRCTSLQHLIQDKAGARTGIACVTPAYVGGRFVGAFGSTLSVAPFFADALHETLSGATGMVLRRDGALLAYAGSVSAAGATEGQVASYAKRFGLDKLAALIRSDGRRSGVRVSPDGRELVAYGRLSGPDWYFALSYPARAVTWSAARSASVVLVLGLLASLMETLIILRMARHAIITPLQHLARSCEGQSGAAALEARLDEIGVLARALRAERNRADELLSSLEQRVLERTAELERANAEKSRFLANMSHELRTPLNGVIAVSETLAREQTTPRNTELAQLIVASGRLLEQVLTDILDFSKIEAGEMRVESRPFDIAVVNARVAELHRASAEAKGVRLEWATTEAAAGCYLGDSVRLTQVLSNLLSNAVKFTSEGEVRLTVDRRDGVLHLEVADTGIGFDEAAKARLFHRFEQADVSIRRRFGGTGLGLAICRSLVELMGGEIDARSTPGQGAVFAVRLPLVAVEPAAETAPDDVAPPAELPGLKVLLAEDHPTNQRVVRLILEAVGVDLSVVENGALALDAFAQGGFDLVLMDMQMPEMDGLTATAELRALEQAAGLPRTPVIMLTANALDEHVQASLAAGADMHLAKPLRADELLDAIALLTCGSMQGEAGLEAAA
jgi:signal transduction histidine kinase/ActR/RegA family two-component response regulator